METLYAARFHGFLNLTRLVSEPALKEENVLSLLIVLSSSVSLVGLVFAFITYSLFSDLRSLSGTALMNLLASLFMTQLLYVIGVGGMPEDELCLVLALALQYLKLCTFCWLIVLAHHMHGNFQHFEKLLVAPEKSMGRTFIKYSVFAWGAPLVFLAVSSAIQLRENSTVGPTTSKDFRQNCWFLDANAFVYGFLLPSATFTMIICSYLLRSAVVARYVISMQVDKRMREKMSRKRTLQMALFTKITLTLIAVTVLGAICKLAPAESYWIAFHVAQGLQGIFVTMLVICNCQVLRLYTKKIVSRNEGYRKTYGNLISGTKSILGGTSMAKSTSMQLLTREPIPDVV